MHLGCFMSVARLQAICRTIAQDLKPDLVLLTGDCNTPEADFHPTALAEALQPLKELKGRVFACLGNHDKETQRLQDDIVRQLESVEVCGNGGWLMGRMQRTRLLRASNAAAPAVQETRGCKSPPRLHGTIRDNFCVAVSCGMVRYTGGRLIRHIWVMFRL